MLTRTRKTLDKSGFLPLVLTFPRIPYITAWDDGCSIQLHADRGDRASVRQAVLQAVETGKIAPIIKDYAIKGYNNRYTLIETWPIALGQGITIRITFDHPCKTNGEPWRTGDIIPTGCPIQENYTPGSSYGAVACSL